MWPQLAFGVVVMGLAWIGAPALFWWGLVMTAGYVLAIPFGVWLAEPKLGELMARWKLCAIPEEIDTPVEVAPCRGTSLMRPHTDSAIRRAREALGSHLGALERSLEVYYGNPRRDAAMDALYARFLPKGGLAFDIGSHVGDRVASFRRLGARSWRWSRSHSAPWRSAPSMAATPT